MGVKGAAPPLLGIDNIDEIVRLPWLNQIFQIFS